MRPGPNNRRMRGRGGSAGGGGNGGPRKPYVNLKQQTFDSNGGDIRVRGNAYQVLEKYLGLARDASSAGDRIAAENYFQHAEHYYRLINAFTDGAYARYRHGLRPDGSVVEDEGTEGDQPEGDGNQPQTVGEAPAMNPDPAEAPQPNIRDGVGAEAGQEESVNR